MKSDRFHAEAVQVTQSEVRDNNGKPGANQANQDADALARALNSEGIMLLITQFPALLGIH